MLSWTSKCKGRLLPGRGSLQWRALPRRVGVRVSVGVKPNRQKRVGQTWCWHGCAARATGLSVGRERLLCVVEWLPVCVNEKMQFYTIVGHVDLSSPPTNRWVGVTPKIPNIYAGTYDFGIQKGGAHFGGHYWANFFRPKTTHISVQFLLAFDVVPLKKTERTILSSVKCQT